MHHSIFISGATQEFGRGLKPEGETGEVAPPAEDDAPHNFRVKLEEKLETASTSARIQEKFTGSGVSTLLKLDNYIKKSSAVVHLVGRVTGSTAKLESLKDLRKRYPKLAEDVPMLAGALAGKVKLSYTQWEAYLAIYHGKPLYICEVTCELPLSPKLDRKFIKPLLQKTHLARLRRLGRHNGISFNDPTDLAVKLWQSFNTDGVFSELPISPEFMPPASVLPPKDSHPLFGRDEAIETGLRYLQAKESRLVTVHAPPGVGKTRVVKRLAHLFHDSPEQVPVYFFEVKDKDTIADVTERIRRQFGFEEFKKGEENDAQQELGMMLNRLGPALLVLDNFEQIDARRNQTDTRRDQTNTPRVATQTVNKWLSWAKDLRILIGSRRRLELDEWLENCIDLKALPAPSIEGAEKHPASHLRASESVKLFISRVPTQKHIDENCDENTLRRIARIVARTGGFPCAIVIAAARLGIVGLDHIEKYRKATFTLPKGGAEDMARYYLHTQLDQMFDDLSKLEQRCILQASQFLQGFTFETAIAVFNPDPLTGELEADEVEAILRKLLLAELLHCETTKINGEEVMRYGFYLPIEEWAEEKWDDDHFVSQTERDLHYHRCVDYFCGYFEPLNEQAYTHNSAEALDRIKMDRPNLTECHDQACARRDVKEVLRIMRILFPSLHHQGPSTLLRTYLEKTMQFVDEFSADDHVALLDQQAMCFSALGRWEEMFATSKQSLTLAETVTNPKLKLACQMRLHAARKHLHGERDTGELDARLSEQLFAAGDWENYCTACKESASFQDWSGKPDEGLQMIESALRAVGARSPSGQGFLLNMGGLICWHDGRPREAVRYLRAALPLFRRHGPQNWPAGVLTNLGLVYIDLEKFSSARCLLTRAAEQHSNSAWMAVNDVAIARLYLRSRQYQQAIDWCERVTASVEATQYHENKALLSSVHGAALFTTGRLKEADQHLHLALERMRPNAIHMRRYFGALVISADCAVSLGNPDYAKECLAEAELVAKLRRIDAACAVPVYRRLFERLLELQSQLNQAAS